MDHEAADSVDLTRVLSAEHSGKWVALTRDYRTVIASGESMSDVSEKVGSRDVVLMLVPDFDSAFAPESEV